MRTHIRKRQASTSASKPPRRDATRRETLGCKVPAGISRWYAIHCGVREGRWKMSVSSLCTIEECQIINQREYSRGNPCWCSLLVACIYEKENVVEYLLRQDLIDISIVHQKTGCNGLHFAASWCTSTRILGLLLSHTSCSFDIELQKCSSRTPLDCVKDNPNHSKRHDDYDTSSGRQNRH